MSKHILVVDDDELLRRSLAYNLEQAGYSVLTAASAEDALALAQYHPIDLVLLDIGLPGMDGLQALKRFQTEFHLPVIFLTARRRELDEIVGLELGAEDYITKPFNTDVLLAHIRAVLRRVNAPAPVMTTAAASSPSRLAVGDLEIDPEAHTAMLNGNLLNLSPRGFDLLYVLAANAGKVMSTDELLAQVWGAEYAGESQVVYVHMRWLREKLEADPSDPQRIITVRGVGYKLIPQDG